MATSAGSLGAVCVRPGIDGFYLRGFVTSSCVARVRDRSDSFWVGIDPFGDGNRYLVTVEQASVGALVRRPTESHPGLRERFDLGPCVPFPF